ncbi:MAG: hypothetical protein K1X94_34095 [Sandaracinaceae bacterium]|nr:hypothetical protein [Sandaracinaceae bacterium]
MTRAALVGRHVSVVAALVSGTACTPAPAPTPSCDDLGVVIVAAGPAERRVLGSGVPYDADPMLGARTDELASSQRARRAAAWAAVARVLAPEALAETTPVDAARVPTFRTWYDREDVNRMFQHAFEGIGPERRAARSPFDEGELDATMTWNTHAVDAISGWSPERFDEYVAGLHGQRAIDGLGGIRRTLLSPAAARHVLASYAEITRCLTGESPPAFVDGRASTSQTLDRVELALTRCHDELAGPYFVADGATLGARLDPEGAGVDDAVITVLTSVDGLATDAVCDGEGLAGCEAHGPGAFFVSVHASGRELRGTLEVSRTEPSQVPPGCLRGSFPLASATLALHWQRADLAMPLPVFDTSASALRRRLDSGDLRWGDGDGFADPGDADIYTMTVPAGPSYRLAAFHLRTHEVDHWLNVTLWWSPDPDTDFGADRPDAIRALGGPWDHYKMCVAVDYDEHDPVPSGGFDEDAPTLARALEEVHEARSWCSNPYIDAAPGLLRGNCVGCHQHAMGGRAPGEIALDPDRFPDSGRTRTRNNEPAEGLWSLEVGDQLGAVIRDTVGWWDAAE